MGTEIELLEPEESERLNQLETIIKLDIKGFLRVGMALKEIKERRLYRGKYATWKQYLREEWDISRGYAHYQIASYDVVENLKSLSENVHHGEHFENNIPEYDPEESYPVSDFVLPRNERQARPLTLLPPEQQVAAWKKVLKMTNGKVTALAVTKVVQDILCTKREEERQETQKKMAKDVSVPEDFSVQFTRICEILALYRKAGWDGFNRKKALEYIEAIKSYLKS